MSVGENRTMEKALFNAVRRGNTATVLSLIKDNVNVMSRYSRYKVTPIMCALINGHIETYQVLRNAGARLLNKDKSYALMLACKNNHVEATKILIDMGAQLYINYDTPFNMAIENDNIDIVDYLIQAGANFNDTDKSGNCPLLKACEKGNHKIVNLLLDLGINPNIKNPYTDETPLIVASINGHIKTVRLLLHAGANVNAISRFHNTSLICASKYGHHKIAQILIDAGANLNIFDSLRFSAFDYAIQNGYIKIVYSLLQAGSTIDDIELVSFTKANEKGYRKIVKLLLNLGFDPNKHERNGLGGQTPLIYASKDGHLWVVRKLLNAGANINAKCVSGCTPLISACESGQVKIVQYLLDIGANLNSKNNFNKTGLDYAIKYGHTEVVTTIKTYVSPRKKMAAYRIHRFWRDVCYNPIYVFAQRRLIQQLD